jgi:hypothetical protein
MDSVMALYLVTAIMRDVVNSRVLIMLNLVTPIRGLPEDLQQVPSSSS